jgi:hypothetical protein
MDNVQPKYTNNPNTYLPNNFRIMIKTRLNKTYEAHTCKNLSNPFHIQNYPTVDTSSLLFSTFL